MSTPRRIKVSDAIRILQRKRDASARATHLMVGKDSLITYEKALTDQAEGGIVPNSTLFERNIMSTKTSIKRIALVAAAALTLGGFSVITAGSAHAADAPAAVTGIGVKNAAYTTVAALTTPGTKAAPVSVTAILGTTLNVGIATTNSDAATKDTFTYYGTDSTFTTPVAAGPFFKASTGAVNTGQTVVTSGLNFVMSTPGTAGTYYYAFATGDTNTAAGGYLALTVVPAMATTYDGTIGGIGSASVSAVAGPANTVTLTAFETSTLRGVVTVSGAGATIASVGGTAQTAGTVSVTLPVVSDSATVAVVINTPSVGTVTANYYAETAQNAGTYSATPVTTTINVVATGSSGVLSTTNSTFYDTTTAGGISGGATASLTSAPSLAATAGATAVARYDWALLDALKAAMPSTTSYTVTMTGPGTLGTTSAATSAGSRALSGKAASGTFYLFGDGTSGTTTITVSSGSTVIGTKTVNFYSSTVASLSATLNHGQVPAAAVTGYLVDTGTAGVTSFVSVVAKDASGNAIPSLTNLSATSSSTSVLTVGVPSYDSTDKVYYVPVTGVAAGTATVTVKDSTGTIATTPVSLSVSKAVIDSVSVAFGASTYNAGDAATLLITAKDSTGAPVADGYYVGALTGAFTSSQALQTSLFGTTLHFVGGVATAKFYAPYNAGNLIANGYLGSSTTIFSTAAQAIATAGTAQTATTSIIGAGGSDASLALDAANAATDAANNAYDEAQNATQAASDALAAVKALAVQVKALIALVTKIKNKVGA
jgi:trimeric autotransporter adhesin